jgi:hypothetical protein
VISKSTYPTGFDELLPAILTKINGSSSPKRNHVSNLPISRGRRLPIYASASVPRLPFTKCCDAQRLKHVAADLVTLIPLALYHPHALPEATLAFYGEGQSHNQSIQSLQKSAQIAGGQNQAPRLG